MECDLTEISNKWLNAGPDSPGYIDVVGAMGLGSARPVSPPRIRFLAQASFFDVGCRKLQSLADSTHLGNPLGCGCKFGPLDSLNSCERARMENLHPSVSAAPAHQKTMKTF